MYDPYENDPDWGPEDPGLTDYVLALPGRRQMQLAATGCDE